MRVVCRRELWDVCESLSGGLRRTGREDEEMMVGLAYCLLAKQVVAEVSFPVSVRTRTWFGWWWDAERKDF